MAESSDASSSGIGHGAIQHVANRRNGSQNSNSISNHDVANKDFETVVSNHNLNTMQSNSMETNTADRPEKSTVNAIADPCSPIEESLTEEILRLTSTRKNLQQRRREQSSHKDADLECKRVRESRYEIDHDDEDDDDDDDDDDLQSRSKYEGIQKDENKSDRLEKDRTTTQSKRYPPSTGPSLSSSDKDQDPSRSSHPPMTVLERHERIGAPIGVGAHSVFPSPEYGTGNQAMGVIDSENYDPETAPPNLERQEQAGISAFVSRQENDGNLPSAEIVDDIETIMYAENVELDNFRRKLRATLMVVFCVCVIIIVVLLPNAIQQRDSDDDIFSHDPRCSRSLRQESVAVECYCTGSAKYAWDSLSEEAKQLYYWSVERLRKYEAIGPEHIFDEDDCNPHNQALLLVVKTEFGQPGHVETIRLQDPEFHRQLHILSHFYASMGGIDWLNSYHWYDTDDYCHWYGVECEFFHLVTHLRLPNNFLHGSIPHEIEYLKWIKVIDLSNNPGINGTLPTELGVTTSLRTLDVSGAQLTGTIPSEISHLKRLDTLKLGGNNLEGTIPNELFQLDGKLRTLDLSRNNFQGSIPEDFGRHSLLESLDVSGNSLSGTLPTDVQALSSLEVLFLGHNQFSGPIPEQLGTLPVLGILGLDFSGFDGSLPEAYCENTTEVYSRHILMNCQNETKDCSCCDRDFKSVSLNRLLCSEMH